MERKRLGRKKSQRSYMCSRHLNFECLELKLLNRIFFETLAIAEKWKSHKKRCLRLRGVCGVHVLSGESDVLHEGVAKSFRSAYGTRSIW